MVKLIACDLDGTLLDPEKRLPEEIFEIIARLHDKGILFAPASGRQYANLKALFSPAEKDLVYICENGAHVKYRGQLLFLDPIPAEKIHRAIDEIRAVPHLFPMLCGVDYAYIENEEEPFFTAARDSYTNCALVDDLHGVLGKEPICKISVFDEFPAAEHGYRVLPEKLAGLRVILSGSDWCDVSAESANKGNAIRFLRAHFGFEKEECVAFGDQMNDLEMLLECGHAFLPENAYPPLKARFSDTVPSNTEGGVLTKLKEILLHGGNL